MMKSRQGQLLLAAPSLADPNFERSVVLIVQHTGDGALGLVLNRPTETMLRDAWEQVADSPCRVDQPVHLGGPCEGPLMLLHSRPDRSQIEVLAGVHFTTEPDDIAWLLEHHEGALCAFAGYAGWGPRQLEAELRGGSWRLAQGDADLVLHAGEDLWTQVMNAIDPIEAQLSRNPHLQPPDPSVN